MRTAILLAVLFVSHCAANLDFSRVHYVDSQISPKGVRNFLFRGNMPTNSSHEFAFQELMGDLRTRATEAGFTLPTNAYLIDVSLNNIFDGQDFDAEVNFWKVAPSGLGKFINWPLGLAGILPPSLYSPSEIQEMALVNSSSSVWKVDQIPSRIVELRTMLQQDYGRAAAVYVHCTAGCDRTGEVIGAYRLFYQTQNLTDMYALDTSECGRSPNYFSTGALEWYCYTYSETVRPIGDCQGFATCEPFGHCHPTGKP